MLELQVDKIMQFDEKWYAIKITQHGEYDIYSLEDKTWFAHNIANDDIEETVDKYEVGQLCDFCKSEGFAEDAEGYMHRCPECSEED